MIRPALVLAVSGLLAVTCPALAQSPPAPSSPASSTDQRLDRIDGKLDEILRRLGVETMSTGQSAPSSAPAQAPQLPAAAVVQPESTAYKPGAVAIVHEAPDKPRDLQSIPADSVGGFVYAGGPIALHDLKSKGVRYTGLAGLELQGWLKITTAGRTQLGMEFRAITGANAVIAPSCIAAAWLENRSIGTETREIPVPTREEKTLDLVLGADLEPGLYRLRVWAACTPTAISSSMPNSW
ncbi:hypothetical protein SAMN05519104_8112 [Rhizobiales bacterium GAS188]|nr:hypothetical protein SAMN05519104_7769 [Rhizobiales bacterium GAS188]SEF05831.1 hypothetical protein SAMN05519104_8112 [Rhizobiales bacterium GAS188]